LRSLRESWEDVSAVIDNQASRTSEVNFESSPNERNRHLTGGNLVQGVKTEEAGRDGEPPFAGSSGDETSSTNRSAGEIFILATGLSKTFGTNTVLHDVNLEIRQGEILVLLGPNGAGKSTMLNIIGGTLQPTSGSLAIYGRPIDLAYYNGLDARRLGIQRVFQELSTFPNLSVAENLDLTSASAGHSSRRSMVARAVARMRAFPGNRIPVHAEVNDLTVAERQMVEITRAMTADGTRLVILDEPTSALSAEEAKQLGALVRRRASEGVAIVYVTHKLEEALSLADRVVVLRDGKKHWDGDARTLTHDHLLALLGAKVEKHRPNREVEEWASKHGDILTVEHLSTPQLQDISIRVGSGEIVGLAGLEGAGQRELLQAIFDARGGSHKMIASKGDIAYVSGDRKKEGLLPLWSVEENVSISAVPKTSRWGFVDFGRLREITHSWLRELKLEHRAHSPIVSLSGGNQQRALLARALASDAPMLLLDDPTRGVDVNAKGDIYEILDKLREKHRSAIFYSTEAAEFRKCDRVYVMTRGHIAAEFKGSEATEERIVQASFVTPIKADADAEMQHVEAAIGVAEAGLVARQNVFKALLTWRALPAAILLIAMLGLAFYLQPRAFSTFGLNLLLSASIPLAFAVLAQMLFLLGGDIDLSIGFAVGLVNVVAATYMVDAPLVATLALCAIVAGYIALALLVELVGVSSIVATLGASFVWLGIGLMIRETPGGSSPDWLRLMTSLKLWPLPLPTYYLIGAIVIGVLLTRTWSYSTKLRALGNNKKMYVSLGYSPLAGRVTLYALAGILCVVSGLLVTATTGAGNINVAAGYTLSTVAAVVVGGASFAGGIVSAPGAVMAVVGMSLISTNLVFLGVSSEYAAAIGGLVLVLVLSTKSLIRPREI
jgi:ribose transport system ATP-binding protein